MPAPQQPSVLPAAHFLSAKQPFHVATTRMRSRHIHHHTHDGFAEFFVVREGRLWHRFNGTEEDLPTGELVWVRERDVHALGHRGKETVITNIAFATALAHQAAQLLQAASVTETLTGPGAPLRVTLDPTAFRGLLEKLDAACGAYPGQDRALRVVMVEVLAAVLPARAPVDAPAAGRRPVPDPPEWLTAFCAWLDEPEHFVLPATEWQAFAHKSPEHLARSFRKFLDLTPTEYVNARRLEHAARMLAGSNEKILSVAFQCGFEQPGYFYRLFRRRFGVTPRQYRMNAHRVVGS